MNSYKYLAIQDIDELIVPIKAETIPAFLIQLNKVNRDILIGSFELRKVNCRNNKDDGGSPYFTAQCGSQISGPNIGETCFINPYTPFVIFPISPLFFSEQIWSKDVFKHQGKI